MSNPHLTSSMFQGASNIKFANSTVIMHSDRLASFDRLEKAVSASAFHSYVGRPDPGTCFPNTRVDLLQRMEKWSNGMQARREFADDDTVKKEDDDLLTRPVLWINGGAGAGKSAVAQTFAERCEDLGYIVASFFFFSTDSTRNTADRLVASLAYQIARDDPYARVHIEAVVHQDPRIFDRDLRTQFSSLILNPIALSTQLRRSENPGHQRPCVVIIDGLDECAGAKMQVGIIRAIFASLRAARTDQVENLPRIIVCSRPEELISRAFGSSDILETYTSIDLSRSFDSTDDITTFLQGKFAEIKKDHPRADLIPDAWPSRNDLEILHYNSSDHFIYAETIIRHISMSFRPVLALRDVLARRTSPQYTSTPFAELDALYHHILSGAVQKSNIDIVRHIFGLISIPTSIPDYGITIYPDPLAQFLDLSNGELDAVLSATSSLVSNTKMSGLQFHHKSLVDFLFHAPRSGPFYMSRESVNAYASE